MAGDFCNWSKDGDRTKCHRCGSVAYHGGNPICPPWITHREPDGKRLPHIKTAEENRSVYRTWIDDENYKLSKTK